MAKKATRKVVIAGMIGNGLEWYDFALYGHFVGIISKLFFPSDNQFVSLIATFGVFAIGFVMRPIGAILFGYLGDKYGRKTSLALSILMMAIPTSFIGLLPTYAQIGIAAPILLTIIRLIQGIALGGEFSGSITYMVEHSAKKNKYTAGTLSVVSLAMGILLGSAVASIFANMLSKEDLEVWGWRIPFIIGFFIGIIGLYIRSYLDESPEYENAKEFNQLSDKPVRELLTKNLPRLLMAIGLYMTVTVPFYIMSVFMNTFMSKFLGISIADALTIGTISMFVFMSLVYISGVLSDKYGSKPVLLISLIMMIIAAWPIFALINQQSYALALIGNIFFAGITALYAGTIPTVLVEMFPIRVRYTGMALACNVCAAAFGGTAPIVLTKLLELTNDNMVVAQYVIFCAVISLISLSFYNKTKPIKLEKSK